MKKILSSIMACLLLICLSFPAMQLHATAPPWISTADVNIKLVPYYWNVWRTTPKVQVKDVKFEVINIPEGYKAGPVSSGIKEVAGKDNTYQFTDVEVSTSINYNGQSEYDKVYRIIYSTLRRNLGDNEKIPDDFTIDLSKFESDENSEFYPYYGLIIDKTEQTVQGGLGDTISLKLPTNDDIKFLDMKASNFKSTNENIDAENLIKWSSETLNGSLSGKISQEVKPGTKLTFDLSFTADDVNYNSTKVVPMKKDTYPRIEGVYDDPKRFTVPVELTIEERPFIPEPEEPGDEDIDVIFTVSPEYKKLTQKGETYKIQTDLRPADSENEKTNELFESMNFKVLFKSGNENIATVSNNGTVTAMGNGSTEITAYVEGYEGKLFGISKVDVEIPGEPIESSDVENSDPNTSNPTTFKTGDDQRVLALALALIPIIIAGIFYDLNSKKSKK